MLEEYNIISLVQDLQSLKSELLLLEEALDTKVCPKSFFIYNDDWISDKITDLKRLMHDKYGIDVPESEC